MDTYLNRLQIQNPDYDWVESIRVKNADALNQVTKHISEQQYILRAPARSSKLEDNGEDDGHYDGEDDGEGELDPDMILMQGLVGPGAVIIDGKTVLVHNWLGSSSTEAIVCQIRS